MKVDGQCHCGQIRFRAEVDPAGVIVCHCTDCQTLSGSAYRTVAPALPGSFELLAGSLKEYVKTAENGADTCKKLLPVGMIGVRLTNHQCAFALALVVY